MAAHTAEEFKQLSLRYFMNNTSILTNFGFVVLIGFIVGAAVTGQIFYNFTLDNLRHFGVFKAMGATNGMLLKNDFCCRPHLWVSLASAWEPESAQFSHLQPGAHRTLPCRSTGSSC